MGIYWSVHDSSGWTQAGRTRGSGQSSDQQRGILVIWENSNHRLAAQIVFDLLHCSPIY